MKSKTNPMKGKNRKNLNNTYPTILKINQKKQGLLKKALLK